MKVVEYLLSSIIAVEIPLIFTKIIFNSQIRRNKIRVITVNIIALISSILIYMSFNGLQRSILMIIIYIILLKQTYNITIGKSIISVVTQTILLIFLEVFILQFMVNVIGLSREYCYEVFAGSVLSNLIVYSSLIVICFIMKKLLLKLLTFKEGYNLKVLILAILSLLSVLVFFYDITANFRVGSRIIFYVIAIFTFVLALVIVIFEENKNLKLKTEYEKLLDFMQIYEEEIEKERIIKHEYKNQLITIKSKIIDNDNENKIIDYINNVIEDESSFAQEEYTKFQYLPPNGLKALLYFKVSSAKSKNINVSVNISSSVKDSFLAKLTTKDFKDLGILLGVFIDNAIEASINSDKKLLGLEIYEENNEIIIIISNSYTGQINTNKVGKEHFSTKGKGRGYGLLLVKKILKHNNRFECEKEITSSLYIQNIIIKNSEE